MNPPVTLEELIPPLTKWFAGAHRSLPWRSEPTPYHVWVSEIMLQQTRVEAVKRYYARFLEHLPTVAELAACPEDRLLKLWEGLGYYNRARNMQQAAKDIMETFDGAFPSSYEEILSLKGIGSYTAGAISSIAFHLPYPAVDGNVLRVLMRVFGWDLDIALGATKTQIERLLKEYLDRTEIDPGQINQSLMELGALVCLPNGEPHCAQCPWESVCVAHQTGRETELPVKKAAKQRRIEARTIVLVTDRDGVLLKKRPKKGLLAGLYEFLNLDGKQDADAVLATVKNLGFTPLRITSLPAAKHIFSHVEWHMCGFLVRVEEVESALCRSLEEKLDAQMVDRTQLEEVYAVPSAFRVYTQIAKTLVKA
mgnify:CR=1 FL=1